MHRANDAATGHHTVAPLQRGNHLPRFLLLLLLWADQQEVKHHKDQHQWQELCRTAEHIGCALRIGGGNEHRHGFPGCLDWGGTIVSAPFPSSFPDRPPWTSA